MTYKISLVLHSSHLHFLEKSKRHLQMSLSDVLALHLLSETVAGKKYFGKYL